MKKSRPKERGSYRNDSQKEQLVQFVETNYNELFGATSDGTTSEMLWNFITSKLNVMGPSKDAEGWKRCFKNLRSSTKSKYWKQRKNGSSNLKMSDVELKIIQICKMETDFESTYPENANSSTLDISNISSELVTPPQEENSKSTITIPKPVSTQEFLETGFVSADNVSSKNFEIEESDVFDKMPLLGENEENTIPTEYFINDYFNSTVNEKHPTPLNVDPPTVMQEQNSFHSDHIDTNTNYIPQSQNEQLHGNLRSSAMSSIEQGVAVNTDQSEGKDSTLPNDKRSYANVKQQKRLVHLVGEHFSTLFGRVSNRLHADILKAKIWRLITVQLNCLGPKKTTEGWKRCLTALKDKTKKKLTRMRQNLNRYGSDSKQIVELNEIETDIAKMFSVEMLDGSGKLDELGLNESAKTSSPADISSQNYLPHQPRNQIFMVSERNSPPRQRLSTCTNSTVTSAMINDQLPPPKIIELSSNSGGNNSSISTSHMGSLDRGTLPVQEPLLQVSSSNHIRPNTPLQTHNDQLDDEWTHEHEGQLFRNDDLHCIQANSDLPELGLEMEVETTSTLSERFGNVLNEIPQNVAASAPRHHMPDQGVARDPFEEQGKSEIEEIRPLQEERPQRRGVEVNLNRYVRPQRIEYGENGVAHRGGPRHGGTRRGGPRRVRLSVPLAVMAEESLDLQRKGNALLAEIIFELKNRRGE